MLGSGGSTERKAIIVSREAPVGRPVFSVGKLGRSGYTVHFGPDGHWIEKEGDYIEVSMVNTSFRVPSSGVAGLGANAGHGVHAAEASGSDAELLPPKLRWFHILVDIIFRRIIRVQAPRRGLRQRPRRQLVCYTDGVPHPLWRRFASCGCPGARG